MLYIWLSHQRGTNVDAYENPTTEYIDIVQILRKRILVQKVWVEEALLEFSRNATHCKCYKKWRNSFDVFLRCMNFCHVRQQIKADNFILI